MGTNGSGSVRCSDPGGRKVRIMADIPKDARIFVAGHRGLVGSAVAAAARGGGLHQPPRRQPRAARPPRPGGGQLLVPGQPAGVRVPRRRHRRRDPGELHPAGRVPLRQHDDPRHGRARRPPVRRRRSCSTSAARASTRARPRSRSPRSSCSPARSSPPTRRTPSPRSPASSCARPTAGSTAATSSPPCRPTSTDRTTTSTSTERPRAAGADPQVPRGQAGRRATRSRSGAPARRGASSSTSTTSPTRACS